MEKLATTILSNTKEMEIKEIELQTDNIEETAKFYSDLLGFEEMRSETKTISFKAGRSILTFIKSDRLNPQYHFAFNIPNNKLDEALAWILTKTGLIANPENEFITNFDNWNAKALYFYDNNGNILEFITRFDLNVISDKPFSAKSIQSISEIGIVTDEPVKLAENLINENQLFYYVKGPKREDFAALGDENGLFIISSSNRNWYPTEQRAERHYVKIKISLNDVTREIRMYEEKSGR